MEDASMSAKLIRMNKLYNKGIDDCEFYIQTNKGHQIKPVIKIASGGEISDLPARQSIGGPVLRDLYKADMSVLTDHYIFILSNYQS